MLPFYRRKKAPQPFAPPSFEPIEQGPRGTWYRKMDGGFEAGAFLPRGIRFFTAWASFILIAGFFLYLLLFHLREIEWFWLFTLMMSLPTLIALGFAVYLCGKVSIRLEGESLYFERGVLFFKRKRRVPLAELIKVKLLPRTTTLIGTRTIYEPFAVARIDFTEGAGLTMALWIETLHEELEIARDLDLQKTFYLRYVLVSALRQFHAQGEMLPANA